MKQLNNFDVTVPELGDVPNITQVSDALESIENALAGTVEFMDAVVSGTEITLTSSTRTVDRLGYYDGMALRFVSNVQINANYIATAIVDGLPAQPLTIPFLVTAGDTVTIVYDTGVFDGKYSAIPRSNDTNSTSVVTVATSLALKTVKDYADTKEPAITKETGFNKAFGSIAGTVSEGNHTHLFADITDSPYSVGDYWITESATNPATKWAGTTWSKVEGRTLLGSSISYSLGAESGLSSVALTSTHVPSHRHSFSASTNSTGSHAHTSGNHRHRADSHAHTQPTHTHTQTRISGATGSYSGPLQSVPHGIVYQTVNTGSGGGNTSGSSAPYTDYVNPTTSSTGSHTHTASGDTGYYGSGSAFNIMNPYRAVNIWRRTA